jgi:hypothetical protein
VFLHENGLDITLMSIKAYRSPDGGVLVTVSQLWPPPDVEDFTISPRSSAQAKQQIARERKQRASIVERVAAAGALQIGAELTIIVPLNVGQDSEKIQTWLNDDPSRSVASWTGELPNPLRWGVSDDAYTPRSLIAELIQRATEAPPQAQVWGPNWFRTADGKTLAQIGAGLPDPG